MSPPADYVEEAADLLPDLLRATDPAPRTLLELGCGGGSLAWHLKPHFTPTLTDLSPQMLAVSRTVNPGCEHVQGDMRTIDLQRTFDVVLMHDAIMYMTDEGSLRAALANARRHCRAGGTAMIVPDFVRETFEPDTEHGGADGGDGRALRYLEWTWDPDPDDTTVETAYTFTLREADGSMHVELDRHTEGIFPRASWLQWITEAGFTPTSRLDPWGRDVFVAIADR
jgi:ubiquinone/menaquinone biosynthesis C-methylase UbiE